MGTRLLTVNDILAGHVTLDVECLDRIYLNGYVPNLQVGGQVVQFLTKQGFPIPSPALIGKIGASGGTGVLDHGLTRAELDRNDPYNTYRIAGLPPGPISMPGAAALRAVTQPARSDELFFVADGTGGHVFARTQDEHLRNVARWREVERARRQP